jgi:hypothetical protein
MRGSENFPAPLSHEHQVGVEHVNSVTASACQQQPWSRPALSGGRASRGMRLAAPAGSPPQRLVCCRASAQVRLCELVNRLKGVFPAAEAGISAISTFRSRARAKGPQAILWVLWRCANAPCAARSGDLACGDEAPRRLCFAGEKIVRRLRSSRQCASCR